jgi:hypothetical protein
MAIVPEQARRRINADPAGKGTAKKKLRCLFGWSIQRQCRQAARKQRRQHPTPNSQENGDSPLANAANAATVMKPRREPCDGCG